MSNQQDAEQLKKLGKYLEKERGLSLRERDRQNVEVVKAVAEKLRRKLENSQD